MTAYDAWKLDSPPEADEEDVRTECREVDDDGDPCDFDGWVTVWVTNELTTWTCPRCDWEHEESTRDRFCDE